MWSEKFNGCTACEHDLSHADAEIACPVSRIGEALREVPDDDEGPLEQRQENRLMHIHRNLGHPSNRLFVQILKDAKAPDSIIEKAKPWSAPSVNATG